MATYTVIKFSSGDSSDAYKLIALLKKVKGAVPYDGNASVQVMLPLKDEDKFIRIGITDPDLSDPPHAIWADDYQGLPIKT